MKLRKDQLRCFLLLIACGAIGGLMFKPIALLAIWFGNVHHWSFNVMDFGLRGNWFHLQVVIVDFLLYATVLTLLFIPVGWITGRMTWAMALLLGWVLVFDKVYGVAFLLVDAGDVPSSAIGSAMLMTTRSTISLIIAFVLVMWVTRKLLPHLPQHGVQKAFEPENG